MTVTRRFWALPSRHCITGSRPTGKVDCGGAVSKPVSPEQMEIAWLQAELARAKMERV